MNIHSLIKSTFNFFGLDLIRSYKNPRLTLCGLRELNIKSIIDIGANTGQFSRYILGIFPEADVMCFEPLPQPFNILKSWSDTLNGQVRVYNIALGDNDGEADMFYHTDFSPSSSLLPSTDISIKYFPKLQSQERVRVHVGKLDSVLKDFFQKQGSELLIKMDVQGFEDRVIRGGVEVIKKAVACIVEVSLDRFYLGQAGFSDLVILMNDLGFDYAGNLDQVYASDGHVIYFDAVFINHSKNIFIQE